MPSYEVEKLVENLKQVPLDDGSDFNIKKSKIKETEDGLLYHYEIETKYLLSDPLVSDLELIKKSIELLEIKYSGLVFDFIGISYNDTLPELEVIKISRKNDIITTILKVTYYEKE